MKKVIKSLKFRFQFLIFFVILFSCNKDEDGFPRLYHDTVSNTETIIEIDVIPTEGILIDFDEMVEEVNIDYFNRYGMNILFNLKEGQSLPDKIKNEEGWMFIPSSSEKYKLTIYILPDQYVKFGEKRAHGYAVQGNDVIVIRESSYKGSTTAHEIGHLLSLGHHGEWNDNIMGRYSTKEQYDIPSEFVEDQLDSIQINLDLRKRYRDYTSKFVQQKIIID